MTCRSDVHLVRAGLGLDDGGVEGGEGHASLLMSGAGICSSRRSPSVRTQSGSLALNRRRHD